MLKKVVMGLFVLAIGVVVLLFLKQDVMEVPEIIKKSSPVEVVAENLEIPWEVAFLPASPTGGPNGDALITERAGKVKQITKNGTKEVATINDVAHIGEGGLLGMVLHPDFTKGEFGRLYLYYTYSVGGEFFNKVVRYEYSVVKLAIFCGPDDADCGLPTPRLTEDKVIIDKIPANSNHNGGRLAFGPDKKLYITTGDAGSSNLAQDKNSLNGKILRVNDDGTIPEDNPFGTPVWSYGHRNPQGLAWDDQGRLWATEHGRSGAQSGLDELNLIEKGGNYGWPVIQGDEQQEGMVTPVKNSGVDVTWAPAGAAFLPADRQDVNGSVFFGGLRGETLYEYRMSEGKLIEHFKGVYGRIRAVVLGPNGSLYITTSNRDGRGNIRAGDDKLIKIDSQVLSQ